MCVYIYMYVYIHINTNQGQNLKCNVTIAEIQILNDIRGYEIKSTHTSLF